MKTFAKTILIACVLMILPSSVAWARERGPKPEMYVTPYFGINQTRSTTVSADATWEDFLGNQDYQSESRNERFDSSGVVGVRFDYWLAKLKWLGWSMDSFVYEAKSKDVQVDALVLCQYITGRFRIDAGGMGLDPYAGIGINESLNFVSVDYSPQMSSDIDAFGMSIGVAVKLGLLWRINPRIAPFAEYRLVSYHLDAEENSDSSMSWSNYERNVSLDLTSDQFVVGLSIGL